MKKTKLTRAEFLIMRYADDWLIQMRLLVSPGLEIAMNMPSHGLQRSELVTLLGRLFESSLLVARTKARGYFTPSLDEIDRALDEPTPESPSWKQETETFYGYTSTSVERYRELKGLYDGEV